MRQRWAAKSQKTNRHDERRQQPVFHRPPRKAKETARLYIRHTFATVL
jgi:hypothetical protein